jgi:GlpG protein
LGILGEKIENFSGSSHLLLVVIISGAASNFIQYLWSGSIYFGGMSGVVYALLGYLWVASKIIKSDLIALPPGIFGFMIGWLIFCMTPIIPFIFGSGIANAAHLGGLIIGIFLGLLFSLLKVRDS